MASLALRPLPRRAHRGPLSRRRHRRLAVDAHLISVAGAVGSPVHDSNGKRVGALDDLVVRWDADSSHPPLYGAVVRTLRGRFLVTSDEVAELVPEVRLNEPFHRHPVARQPQLVALAHDVLDRQIVDVHGAEVVRVSDLVVGCFPDGARLVGFDVSTRTLLRRLGPRRLRRTIAPKRVYDWASVAAFSERGPGEAGSVLRLTSVAAELRRRGPADLRGLVGDLPPHEADTLSAAIES